MNAHALTQDLPRLAPAAVEAIRRAAGALPPGRQRVNAVDVVLALLALDGAAARVVDVLAPGRIEQVEDALRAVQSTVAPGAESRGESPSMESRGMAVTMPALNAAVHGATVKPPSNDSRSAEM